MEAKKGDVSEFTLEALGKMLKRYAEDNDVKTKTGVVDFHRMAEETGVNHETCRAIYYCRHKGPTWEIWNKITQACGAKILIAK